MKYVLVALVAFLVGRSYGWFAAHKTIESECDKLGGFYVYDRVFKCVEQANSFVPNDSNMGEN